MAKSWLAFVMVAALFILLLACEPLASISSTPADIPTTQMEPSVSADQTGELPGEPRLSDDLKRGCQINTSDRDFEQTGLAVGTRAINFTLKDLQGNEVRLSCLLAEKPVVMIFGSFT